MSLHFSKGHIASFLCLLLGAYLCFAGLHAYLQKNAAIPIETLSPADCTAGQYVYGYIESFVRHRSNSGAGGGVSSSYLSYLGGDADEYTIPIAENYYIRFLAVERDTQKGLENFDFRQQNHLYVEGQIISASAELNDAWYKQTVEFENRDYNDAIIREVWISEISFDQRIRNLQYGIAIVFVSIALFYLSGGTKNLAQVQKTAVNEEPSDRKMRFSYQTQYELEEEQRHLSALYSSLDQLKRRCLYRLPLLLAGILMFIWSDYALGKVLGIICLFLSLRAMIQYFLNSNMQAALYLAKRLHFSSIWLQIMESSKKTQILQRLIEENEAPKN